MNAAEEVSTIKEMNAGDLYDGLQKRLLQVRGIADLIGHVESDGIEDVSLDSTVWAVKDILEQAEEYARALLKIATSKEGGAA